MRTIGKLTPVWWVSLLLTSLVLPWGYFRIDNLIRQTPEPTSLGEGAAFGMLIGIGVGAAVIIAILYAVALILLVLVGLFGAVDSRGPAILSIVVSSLFGTMFVLIGLLAAMVVPLLVALCFYAVAAVSAVHLRTVLSQREPPPSPHYEVAAQPPPPTVPNLPVQLDH